MTVAGIVDRINERTAARNPLQRKGFSEPPFYAQNDPLLVPWMPNSEAVAEDFEVLVQQAIKGSSPVTTCVLRRAQVFSQGRFAWQRWENGVPQDPFGTNDLSLLERPWPNGTTGELLVRCEFDASAAGNSYWTKVDDRGNVGMAARFGDIRLARMRPDWVKLIIDAPSGNPYGPDARVVALDYTPKVRVANLPEGAESWTLLPSEFAHYSPIPDPVARFRGMSWMTSVLTEIQADREATEHKSRIFRNGATFTHAIKFDRDTSPVAFKRFQRRYNEAHSGARNAFKTLFLTPGADLVPMSMSMQQLDLKSTQGNGETRICGPAGVPPAIAGISEGLQGSALNEGNFNAARRLFVDTTIRHMWNIVGPTFETLVPQPNVRPGSRLIIDDRWVPFLQEADRARAETAQIEAAIIAELTREGFTPESAIVAVRTHDWTKLKHTGMLSVQLHDPSSTPALPSLNGSSSNGNGVRNGSQVTA